MFTIRIQNVHFTHICKYPVHSHTEQKIKKNLRRISKIFLNHLHKKYVSIHKEIQGCPPQFYKDQFSLLLKENTDLFHSLKPNEYLVALKFKFSLLILYCPLYWYHYIRLKYRHAVTLLSSITTF